MNFIEWFKKVALHNNYNRIFLEADGGFGKTTCLRQLCSDLALNYSEYQIVPVYIDCKDIIDETVEKYITRAICNCNTEDYGYLYEALKEGKYLIIFDGLNEINEDGVKIIIEKFVSSLIENNYDNIFVVISARDSELLNDYNRTHFTKVNLAPLSNDSVKTLIENDISNPSEELIYVLTNPMMLSIYMGSYNKSAYKNAKNQTEVLNAFFKEQVKIIKSYSKFNSVEKLTAEFVIEIFLPMIMKFGNFTFTYKEIKAFLGCIDFENTVYENQFFSKYRKIDFKAMSTFNFIADFLTNELNMICKKDGNNVKIHQVYADYFFAEYYSKSLIYWTENSSVFPEFALIDTAAGKDGIFDNNYSSYNSFTKSQSIFMYQMSESYISKALSAVANSDRTDNNYNHLIIKKLLDLVYFGKGSFNDFDFKGVDLSKYNFDGVSLENANLENCIISTYTFSNVCDVVGGLIESDIVYFDRDYLVVKLYGCILCYSAKNGRILQYIDTMGLFIGASYYEKFIVLVDKFTHEEYIKISAYDLKSGLNHEKTIFGIDDKGRFVTDERLKSDCEKIVDVIFFDGNYFIARTKSDVYLISLSNESVDKLSVGNICYSRFIIESNQLEVCDRDNLSIYSIENGTFKLINKIDREVLYDLIDYYSTEHYGKSKYGYEYIDLCCYKNLFLIKHWRNFYIIKSEKTVFSANDILSVSMSCLSKGKIILLAQKRENIKIRYKDNLSEYSNDCMIDLNGAELVLNDTDCEYGDCLKISNGLALYRKENTVNIYDEDKKISEVLFASTCDGYRINISDNKIHLMPEGICRKLFSEELVYDISLKSFEGIKPLDEYRVKGIYSNSDVFIDGFVIEKNGQTIKSRTLDSRLDCWCLEIINPVLAKEYLNSEHYLMFLLSAKDNNLKRYYFVCFYDKNSDEVSLVDLCDNSIREYSFTKLSENKICCKKEKENGVAIDIINSDKSKKRIFIDYKTIPDIERAKVIDINNKYILFKDYGEESRNDYKRDKLLLFDFISGDKYEFYVKRLYDAKFNGENNLFLSAYGKNRNRIYLLNVNDIKCNNIKLKEEILVLQNINIKNVNLAGVQVIDNPDYIEQLKWNT